jgi:hypothetical protein
VGGCNYIKQLNIPKSLSTAMMSVLISKMVSGSLLPIILSHQPILQDTGGCGDPAHSSSLRRREDLYSWKLAVRNDSSSIRTKTWYYCVDNPGTPETTNTTLTAVNGIRYTPSVQKTIAKNCVKFS